MNKIQYQILRYLPDRVSGEFVNLGIVAFDPVDKKLAGKFINKIGNISALFPAINSRYLIKSVKTIQEQIERISSQILSEFLFEKKEAISAITQTVLPKDDTALIFSEVKMTLDINTQSTIQDLFARFVKTHLLEEDDEVRKDKEVWNKIYKKHFDDQGISSHFHAHKVKTSNDELEFDRAWKNGAWNCFETVSFNLSRPDAIKNKVYKWVGKLDELNSSKEQLHIYLLSVLPHDHPELTNFINKKIKSKSTNNTKVQIISEKDIEAFTRKLKRQIESH